MFWLLRVNYVMTKKNLGNDLGKTASRLVLSRRRMTNVATNLDLIHRYQKESEMFRFSFVVLAFASALALNGCSQCSNPSTETAPAAPTEAAPAPGAEAPVAPAPVEGAAPAAPVDAAATPAPAETPAAH